MKKLFFIKMFATMLIIFLLQACYVATPVYETPSESGAYEPPPIVLQTPPQMIVIPDTDDVYVCPHIDIDLFFWNGWWWRPWQGRWYRSSYYNRGWIIFNAIPTFYFDVDPGWRGYYKDRRWRGHRWDYERIPHDRLNKNWQNWRNDRYWESRKTWNVQNYKPRTPDQKHDLRRQRQNEYEKRPEFRKPQIQQPQRQPWGQRPQRQPQIQEPQVQPSQQPDIKQPRRQPWGRQPQRQPQIQEPQVQPSQQPNIKQPQQNPQIGQPKRQTWGQQPKNKPQIKQPQIQPQQQPNIKQPQSKSRVQKPQRKNVLQPADQQAIQQPGGNPQVQQPRR